MRLRIAVTLTVFASVALKFTRRFCLVTRRTVYRSFGLSVTHAVLLINSYGPFPYSAARADDDRAAATNLDDSATDAAASTEQPT